MVRKLLLASWSLTANGKPAGEVQSFAPRDDFFLHHSWRLVDSVHFF
jgi:hypothetical protein